MYRAIRLGSAPSENLSQSYRKSTPTETAALEEIMKLPPEEIEAVKARERSQIPFGRRGRPEEVAHWIVSLIEPSNTWITGQVMNADGGLKPYMKLGRCHEIEDGTASNPRRRFKRTIGGNRCLQF